MKERTHRLAWPAAALALAVAARLPSLALLLDRDEGEFATLAWLWRSGLAVPYRDVLEQKPPLSLLPHAAAQALASSPAGAVLALRWISLAWVGASVLGVYALLLALARQGALGRALKADAPQARAAAGMAAMAAALLFSSAGTQSLAANTETWQTLPLLAALGLALLPKGGGWLRWAACGFALGLATLFKQPLLAGVLILPWAAQTGSLLLPLLATGAGVGLAWALAMAPFAAQGAALPLLNCTLAYNQAYVMEGQADAWRRALGLGLHLAPELGLWAALAAWGLWRLRQAKARWGWLGAWAGLGALTLGASGRYYPHYAIVLMGPLAALAGLGAQGLWQAACRRGRAWRWGAAALIAAAVLAWAWPQSALWRAPGGPQRTYALYHVPSFSTAPEAAQRLQALCPPGKRLFLWGDDAEIFFLSQRAPASRFMFTYPFTGEAPAWPDGDLELKAGLNSDLTGAAALCRGLDSSQYAQLEIQQGLSGSYTEEHSVAGWVLGGRR
jgi:hypothetical protein